MGRRGEIWGYVFITILEAVTAAVILVLLIWRRIGETLSCMRLFAFVTSSAGIGVKSTVRLPTLKVIVSAFMAICM